MFRPISLVICALKANTVRQSIRTIRGIFMELTLDSAFSAGGLVGHTSYLLLVLSMVMVRMSLLRILVILSALCGITYDLVWLKDPVGVFWETLLVVVNVVQLAITWQQNRSARFSQEETAFMQLHLAALSLSKRRKLLNQGIWISGETGTELTTQGQAVNQLIYLAQGQAIVIAGGREVAICEQGASIGEMTALQGEAASATVRTSRVSRYWAIDATALRDLIKKYPDIGTALESSFAVNMRDKLVRSNQFIMDAGGVRNPDSVTKSP
jgi:CRP-like cAMP-binding protein